MELKEELHDSFLESKEDIEVNELPPYIPEESSHLQEDKIGDDLVTETKQEDDQSVDETSS